METGATRNGDFRAFGFHAGRAPLSRSGRGIILVAQPPNRRAAGGTRAAPRERRLHGVTEGSSCLKISADGEHPYKREEAQEPQRRARYPPARGAHRPRPFALCLLVDGLGRACPFPRAAPRRASGAECFVRFGDWWNNTSAKTSCIRWKASLAELQTIARACGVLVRGRRNRSWVTWPRRGDTNSVHYGSR